MAAMWRARADASRSGSAGNVIAIAAGDARISAVDVRDNAAAAVSALTANGHEGKTYALTGPEALTHESMAMHLSEAAGHAVRYVEVTEERMHDALVRDGLLYVRLAADLDD